MSGTRKFLYQKWPDQIFPICKISSCPTMVTFVLGGGPGGGRFPPVVVDHSHVRLTAPHFSWMAAVGGGGAWFALETHGQLQERNGRQGLHDPMSYGRWVLGAARYTNPAFRPEHGPSAATHRARADVHMRTMASVLRGLGRGGPRNCRTVSGNESGLGADVSVTRCRSVTLPTLQHRRHANLPPAPGHGQEPVCGTADPRSSPTGQVIRGLC